MNILSTWAGNVTGPFAHFSTNPVASIRNPSGASGANGRGVLRAIAKWLKLDATVRDRVCVSIDQKSWIQDKDAMFEVGDELLCRGRGTQQPLSVAVFDLSDLPELHCVFGMQASRDCIAQTAVRLQRLIARNGLVVRTSATTFTVLLPGVDRDRALGVIRSAMGQPCCIELAAGDKEIVLVPEFMVRTVFDDSVRVSEIYESLCRDIAQARLKEESRRKYLERERESHSRSMKSRPLPVKRQATRASPRHIPMRGHVQAGSP